VPYEPAARWEPFPKWPTLPIIYRQYQLSNTSADLVVVSPFIEDVRSSSSTLGKKVISKRVDIVLSSWPLGSNHSGIPLVTLMANQNANRFRFVTRNDGNDLKQKPSKLFVFCVF